MSKFLGERLRQARIARGLTAVTLSDLLGVTRQAVSQYEKGTTFPSDDVFTKICDKLNLKPQFFFRECLGMPDCAPIFYRSQASATKSARARAEQRFEWVKEFVVFLKDFVTFPEVNIPQLPVPSDPRELSDSEIEEMATLTRRHWGLSDGPISNVARLMEKNGIIVVRHELCADKFDAFSQWSSQVNAPCMVLGDDKASGVRSRFDAAHELAHIVLHREVTQKLLNTKAIYQLIENQAHRFAGAFLMPSESFASDLLLPNLDYMRDLKPKWKTAISAMIMRVNHLGIISDEKKIRRLWINRAQRGWTTREPLDDVIEIEQPSYLNRCFEVLLKNNVIDTDLIESRFGFSLEETEKLCSLPTGSVSGKPDVAPIILRMTGR